MHPRHRLDIGAGDLAFALRASALPDDANAARRAATALARRWLPETSSVLCQSVRSGFDALLTALSLPRGAEVLISGITIPDMLRIVRAHGLVPVPFDLDPHTLEPDVDAARRALSRRTGVVLFAHLFGGRTNVSALVALARAAGVPFVEDCAQAFVGPGDWGHPEADVSMFSFGIIKTSTALGGAIFRVKDPAVAERLDDVQAAWPLQPHAAFRARAARLFGLSALASGPRVYGALARTIASRGLDLDVVLGSLTRGFGAHDDAAFFASVRRRPSRALLALLDRRLARFDRRALDARAAVGERVVEALRTPRFVPGARQPIRTHWLVPVHTPEPDVLVQRLRAAGFDATRGTTSLVAVPVAAEAPAARATACERVMKQVVYVPGYAALGRDAEVALRRELAAGARQVEREAYARP